MRRRPALLAVVAALACAAGAVTAVSPAAADTPVRLLSAQVTATPFGAGTVLALKLRVTGDAVRVDYEYDVTVPTVPTIRFTRSLPVASPELSQSDVLLAFAPQGGYTLKVAVVAADGSTTTYLPDGHAQWCPSSGACARPVGGLTVLSGTGFTRSSGPASAADLLAEAPQLTSADLTTPALGGHISSGGTVATAIGYTGAVTGAAPTGTTVQPIYIGDFGAAYFAGATVGAVAASGTSTSTGAGPTAGTLWGVYQKVLRTGLVDRVVGDDDRVLVHTTWPLSATSQATMPAACGIVAGLSPSTTCALLSTATAPSTGGGSFLVDGVRSYGGQWWSVSVSGGSASTAQVVSNSTHPITFTVHYTGLVSPQGEPVAVTLTGPGAASLDASAGVGPPCPFDAGTGYYTCDVPISVYGVQYNGTYAVTSLSLGLQGTPTLVCAPGPTATLVGYHLLDTTGPASRAAQLCGGIAWSSLRATVTGRAAPPCTDSSAPVLTAFARTSVTAFDATNSPTTGKATFHWAATDTGCGLTRITATFVRPDGLSWVAAAVVSARASGSGTVDLTPQPGSWALQRVAVTDAAGNVRTYDADGVAAAQVGSAPRVRSRHTLDLASAGVLATAGAPPAGVPAPARAIAVAPGGTSFTVSWLAPAPATGVTGYLVSVRSLLTGGATTTVSTTGTHVTVTGLDATTPYRVSVEARHGSTAAAWTPLLALVSPTAGPALAPPAAGPVLRALAATVLSTTVPLSVTASVVPGYPVTGYVLQWSHGTATQALSAWRDLGGVTARVPASVARLALGSKLCVRVLAVNAAGRGPASSTACTTVPLDDRSLSRSSGWSRPTVRGAFRSTLTTTTRRGAVLSFRATGHGLILVVRTSRGAGTLGVYLGSRRIATVSLASSRTRFTTVRLSSRVTGALVNRVVTLRVLTSGRVVAVDGVAVPA